VPKCQDRRMKRRKPPAPFSGQTPSRTLSWSLRFPPSASPTGRRLVPALAQNRGGLGKLVTLKQLFFCRAGGQRTTLTLDAFKVQKGWFDGHNRPSFRPASRGVSRNTDEEGRGSALVAGRSVMARKGRARCGSGRSVREICSLDQSKNSRSRAKTQRKSIRTRAISIVRRAR
jgi:hypothetical protein